MDSLIPHRHFHLSQFEDIGLNALALEVSNKPLLDPTRPCLALIGKRNGTYFVAIMDAEGGVDIPRTVQDKRTAQACFDLIDKYFPGMQVRVDIVANEQQISKVEEPKVNLPGPTNSTIRGLLGTILNSPPYESGGFGDSPMLDQESIEAFREDYDPATKMLKAKEIQLLRPGNPEQNEHIGFSVDRQRWYYRNEKGEECGKYRTPGAAVDALTLYILKFDPYSGVKLHNRELKTLRDSEGQNPPTAGDQLSP